jgi:hypothetical protein
MWEAATGNQAERPFPLHAGKKAFQSSRKMAAEIEVFYLHKIE